MLIFVRKFKILNVIMLVPYLLNYKIIYNTSPHMMNAESIVYHSQYKTFIILLFLVKMSSVVNKGVYYSE